MIRYALACPQGHAFDAWFKSSDAFDRQARRKQVSCPECGSPEIEKQPMAPALVKSRRSAPAGDQGPADQHLAEIPRGGGGGGVSSGLPDPETLRAYRQHVVANTEDVGSQFAEEARKIHYGDAQSRAIRGEATRKEAMDLHEEGVEFGILPVLPDDHN